MIPLAILMIEDDDDQVFMTKLYMTYSGLMYSVAYFYLENHHDAQDVVNDVVVRLIDKIPVLREKNSCVLRSYIVSAIRRTSINALRRRSRKLIMTRFFDDETMEDIPDEHTAVEADAIAHVTHAEIAAVLDKLPNKESNLLRWKYFEEYSDKEIAEFLGISKDSVRAYLTKARRHMYALLERQGFEHEG